MRKLHRKINEVEPFRPEVPPVLKETTGFPVTEFSPILFQSGIQPAVKSAYTKLSENISKLQTEIRDICTRKIAKYRADQTPRNAITTATELRTDRAQIDTDINGLKQDGTNAEELSRLFNLWRILANEIEGDMQLMANSAEDAAAQNLIERLDIVQRDIRQHLANNRMSLKDILSNHEHFKQQCSTIKDEFKQVSNEKERCVYHLPIQHCTAVETRAWYTIITCGVQSY